MKAEIIAVATRDGQIPEGQLRLVVDRLAASGVSVVNIIPVKNTSEMEKAAKHVFTRSNMAVFLYNFASRADRAVKNIVASCLGLNCKGSKELLAHVQQKLKAIDQPFSEDMAYYAVFPDGSKVFRNPLGIQYGFFCSAWKKATLALPCDFKELEKMLDDEVSPFLQSIFGKSNSQVKMKENKATAEAVIGVAGINKIEIEKRLADLITSQNPKVAIVKRQEDTQVKIAATGSDSEVSSMLNAFIDLVFKRLGHFVYGVNVPDIYYAAAKKLSDQGLKVSFAESYTRGELAHNFKASGFSNIVGMEESSASSRTKTQKFGVPEKIIKKFGAVSSQVAIAMAEGARKVGKTNVGIAILGETQVEGKPSNGIVFIAISTSRGKKFKRLNIPQRFSKEQMRRIATFEAALQMRLFAENPKAFMLAEGSTEKSKEREKVISTGKAVDHMGKKKDNKKSRMKKKKSFGRKVREYFIPMRGDSGMDIAKKIILMVALIVFAGSSGYIYYYYGNASDTKEMYNSLKEFVIESNEEVDRSDLPPDYPKEYQPKFVNLWNENQDIAGWVKIDDTIVDYPVVQRPGDRNKYYFRKDFSQKYNKYGVPFVDYETDLTIPSVNTIVYGHNMADGQMFGVLEQYKSLDFYKNNPIVKFNSVYRDNEYVIFGVFLAATREQDEPFNYHRFVNPKSDEEYNNFIKEVRKRSFFSVPIDITPDDELLTLSTCTYTFYKNGKSYKFPDGRLVVMCRKVREGEDVSSVVSSAAWQDALMPKPYYDIDDSTPAVGEKPLQGLTLSETDMTMQVGETTTLTYETSPADATNVNVKWTSSDPNVATVDGGKVKALNAGTTTITLATEDGRISASAKLVVGRPASATKLDEIYFSKEVYNVQEDDTVKLHVKCRPSDFDMDSVNLYYSVEDESIATVNQNGEITGKNIGKTLVYVSTTDSKFSAEAVINVMDDVVSVNDVSIDTSGDQFNRSTLEVFEDQTFSLKAIIRPYDATETDVVWSSSDKHVVKVLDQEDGDFEVTGRVGDRATITVTTVDGNETDKIKVEIVEGELAPVKVTNVDITNSNFELAVGNSASLNVNISPSNATNKRVDWTSSNPSVASVSSSGRVSALAEGTTTIKATANDGSGWTDTVVVTVKNSVTDVKVTSVSISGNSSVEEGKTIRLDATVSPDNATNKDVSWKSNNPSVATVSSNGTVTGVTAGAVNITATAKDGSGQSSTVRIDVTKAAPTEKPVDSISVSGPSQVTVEESINLSVSISPSDATNQDIAWSSSDDGIAMVSSNGKVTGVSEGSATITAESNNGKTATITISVQPKEEEPAPQEPDKPEPTEPDKPTEEPTEPQTPDPPQTNPDPDEGETSDPQSDPQPPDSETGEGEDSQPQPQSSGTEPVSEPSV